jgi:hypothetical protein
MTLKATGLAAFTRRNTPPDDATPSASSRMGPQGRRRGQGETVALTVRLRRLGGFPSARGAGVSACSSSR